MPERPSIPAEIQRQILVESGHRCAVCGAGCQLERAHIIPWHKSKEHKAEDLICLCASCHERADQEEWGEKTLREYKQRPWVMRNYEKLSSFPETTTKVELTIDMELSQFDEQQKRLLQYAVAAFLNISPNDVRIASVKKSNSITVTVELPTKFARKLLAAYKLKDPELLSYLAPFGLIKLRKKVKKRKSNKKEDEEDKAAACYIATATFEDTKAPEVIALRKFRDDVLLNSKIGRVLIKVYYAISPRLAVFVSNSRTLKCCSRALIRVIVATLNILRLHQA
jgi:hypothetical protein